MGRTCETLVETGMLNKMIVEVKIDDDSSSQSIPIKNIAMFAGGFKGRCYLCGKLGHKGYECPDKAKDDEGKEDGNNYGRVRRTGNFRGTCYYCGKVCGNTAANCEKRKADEQKQKENQQVSDVAHLILSDSDDGSVDVAWATCCDIITAVDEMKGNNKVNVAMLSISK